MNNSFRNRRNRRGITAVIAMLFMVLIGTLALGFYATVTTATSLAKNDRRTAKALMAAESGIQFMRNRLAHVTIPPATASGNLLSELEIDLKADDVIAGNLGGVAITRTGNVITIPSIATNTAENSGFVVTLTDIGAVGEIVCTVRGHSGNSTSVSEKGVRLDFTRKPINTSIFDNAVAAKGKFVMTKGGITAVSGVASDSIIKIVSAQKTAGAITMSGGTIGSAAGGELGVLIDVNADGKADPTATVISGGSVHGTTNITTIKNNYVKLVSEPEFPTVDTTQFAAYATNPYVDGATTVKNIRIPANTNPKFNGGVTIQGIMYIESPNIVEFRGNSHMEGFIVFEKANTSAVNLIDARGNFTYGNLPAGAEFDSLRAITGISILAPTASLVMSGSVDSQIRGNMILGNFKNGGSADISIEKGSIITLDTAVDSATFNGKTVKFASTGADNQPPAGVSFTTHFLPTNGSYIELN
jgi:Tfp pilus assembly protein PilX